MNRLRGRKKAAGDEQTSQSPNKAEFPFRFKMPSRFKKPVEESEPEVEFTATLPSNDDFRTSLVMTGLSARFSILRDRESPVKRPAKASDDSVLCSEKHSRTISGIESKCRGIERASPTTPRPSTRSGRIDVRRTDSKKGESVMNRGRTTESNNLFGGRQKINIIPSTRGYGRALYCDDIAPSTFQRWRQSEKERIEAHDGNYASSRPQNSSTTTSAVCSEDRLHQEEKPTNNPGRSRAGTLPTDAQDISHACPPDRIDSKTVHSKASAPSLRSFLPLGVDSAPPIPPKSSGRTLETKETESDLTTPPLSAPVGRMNHDSLRAKKHSKAAALGIQHRPSVKYDEEEYVRRQRQIHQGRKTITNSRARTDLSKQQTKRRSRSYSALNRVHTDTLPSTLQSRSTGEEQSPLPAFLRETGSGTYTIPTSRVAHNHPPGSQTVVASVDDHSFSERSQAAVSPPLQTSRQTRVDSVAKDDAASEYSYLSEPRASLGDPENNLSRDTTTALSGSNPRPQDSHPGTHKTHHDHKPKTTGLGIDFDLWMPKGSQWDPDMEPTDLETSSTDLPPKPAANNPRESEDFARHLSDGAKRIREKMNMHAESDQGGSSSSDRPSVDSSDLPPARPGVFNVLRSKTSNGTLASKRLLSGSLTSSVALSLPYESFCKSMGRDPSGPKSATQSSYPLYGET